MRYINLLTYLLCDWPGVGVPRAVSVGADPAVERRQHRAVDPAVSFDLWPRQTAVPWPNWLAGDASDERWPVAERRRRHVDRTVWRSHVVCTIHRRRPTGSLSVLFIIIIIIIIIIRPCCQFVCLARPWTLQNLLNWLTCSFSHSC